MSASRRYRFVTDWRVRATLAEIMTIMGDARDLPRWWPAVYLAVRELDAGDPATGVGKCVELETKGYLPHGFRFRLTVTENRFPHGISTAVNGDFVGEGHWYAAAEDEHVHLRHVWDVRVDKPIIGALSPVLRPVFASNHAWAMRKGRESLELELQRRRATSVAERARVPSPPPATFRWFSRAAAE